jgi:glycosyltransferase involved in cell wall biosynthesis
MGRAARAHARTSFDWDEIAQRLEEVYVEVCA